MAPRTSDKRERLLAAAKQLIYQQGYSQTTLADIAQAAEVPLGNVYYYFKTKDELTSAVIAQHQTIYSDLYAQWDVLPSPRERLLDLLDLITTNKKQIAAHGCIVGSLCSELNKDRLALATAADAIISEQLAWVITQFHQMGVNHARDLALQFLVRVQGTSFMSHALHDANVLTQQTAHTRAWLKEIENAGTT